MFNYKVIIHEDKPFRGSIDLIQTIKTITRPQTAEVIFLNEDGSCKKSVEYGYVTLADIEELMLNKDDIDLDCCYVRGFAVSNYEIKRILARQAFFDVETRLININVNESSEFSSSIFIGKTIFIKADFNEDAIFSRSTFSGYTFFFGRIKGIASFEQSLFYKEVKFEHPVFEHYANFSGSIFCGRIKFLTPIINRGVDFKNAEVRDIISFENTRFLADVNFDFKECDRFVLDNCTIDKLIDFGICAKFNEFGITKCKNFGQIFLDFDKNKLKDAIYAYGRNNDLSDYGIASMFNILKVNYNKTGRYNNEDLAYVQYRRCIRRFTARSLPSGSKGRIGRFMSKLVRQIRAFLSWLLLDLISCYCTKPFRVLLSALITMIIFALFYHITGTVRFTDSYNGLLGCFYHSVITFFTIGYGNSNPLETIGLLLTGIEGFAGVFLMSLFTVSFVRKALR